MVKGSENPFPYITLVETADPATPPANTQYFWLDTDGVIKVIDESAAVTPVIAAAGAIATDTLWDAAGDLVQGTGANTAAKLGAGLAGQVLRSAGAAAANAWAYPPGYELDYAQITSTQAIAATSEATATTVITGAAVTYDGSTPVVIEFVCDALQVGSGGQIFVVLYDGSSSIGRIAAYLDTSGLVVPVCAKRRITPSAASHTYSVRAYVNSGSGNVFAAAGGNGSTNPAYMRITKV